MNQSLNSRFLRAILIFWDVLTENIIAVHLCTEFLFSGIYCLKKSFFSTNFVKKCNFCNSCLFFFEIHRPIGSLKSISFPNLRKTLIFLKFSEKDVTSQKNGIFYHYLIFQNLATENIILAHFKQGIYFQWII